MSGPPAGAPPPGYVCRRCGQAGHWKEQCVATETRLHPSASHAGDKGGGGAVGPADGGAKSELALCDEEAIEVGNEIAEALEETGEDALATVQRSVAVLGEEAARMLLVQTWQVEEQGGLLTLDGSCRRRTAGGVFLWLVKQQADAAQRRRIWGVPATDRSYGGEGGAEKPASVKRRKVVRRPPSQPAAAPEGHANGGDGGGDGPQDNAAMADALLGELLERRRSALVEGA